MSRWPSTTFAKQEKQNNANRAYHLARVRPPRVKTTNSLCDHPLNSHQRFVAFHLTRGTRTIPPTLAVRKYISSRLRFERTRNGGHFGLAAWRVLRCLS